MTNAERLRDWLDRRGMWVSELARELGVTRQRVYQLLAGDMPSLDLATKLEKLTGIPASSWLTQPEGAKKS